MAIHIPVHLYCHFFFFNDPATTEIYTPSLHDALPILAEEAQAQRPERIVLQARRGTLSDRHGTPLAVTQETYHVGIAPNELRDPTADGALLSRRLGLTARTWQQALRRRYAYFAGPYSALEVQPLRSVRGVHLESVLNRFYPDPAVARATIGRLGDDGLGASGLERTLDSLLAGRAGAAVVLEDRDRESTPLESRHPVNSYAVFCFEKKKK